MTRALEYGVMQGSLYGPGRTLILWGQVCLDTGNGSVQIVPMTVFSFVRGMRLKSEILPAYNRLIVIIQIKVIKLINDIV